MHTQPTNYRGGPRTPAIAGGKWRRYALPCLLLVWLAAVPWDTASADDALDEVVVSARKRSEKAHDVPISLSEVRGAELQQRGLVRVQDVVRAMPNVSTDLLSPRQASLAIRGLGRNPANDALESSVGVFLDGVYLGRPGMMISDLVDLDRMELLRGPQGALFGKNATAGVLNILSAPPVREAAGWLQVSAGDYGLQELRGAVSGPMGSTPLAYRLSGFAARRDGFIDDTTRNEKLGELRRSGARAQLQWEPDDSLSVRLIADYGSQDEDGPGYLLVDPNQYRVDGTLRTTNLVARGARLGYTPAFDPNDRRSDADAPQYVRTENAGVTLLADAMLGGLRLSSITGWRKFSFIPANDGDYSALDVLPELGTNVRSRQFSEELRLASPAEGSLQYLAGLVYFEQRVRSDVFATYGSDASGYLSPGLPASALDGFQVFTHADPGTHSYSAFGQVYWWPREDLEIAAGLRWTAEDKATSVEQSTAGGVTLEPGDVAAIQARQRLGSPQAFSVASSEDFVSGSVSATWHIDENANAYLSVSRGAKSGGVNAAILPPGAQRTVAPEIALGYELGVKTFWLEHRLQLNGAAFQTTVDGYQASIRDRVVGASYLANAGEVSTRGIEAEAIYRPVAGITLTGGVGYSDARYESFRNAACPPELDNQASCDFSGQRVAGAPPLTFNASVEVAKPMGSRYQLRTSIDWARAGGYRAELSQSTWTGTRETVDFRLNAGTSGGAQALTFWVLNLLDKAYYSGMAVVGPGGTGVAIGLLGPPRTMGLSLELRY